MRKAGRPKKRIGTVRVPVSIRIDPRLLSVIKKESKRIHVPYQKVIHFVLNMYFANIYSTQVVEFKSNRS